MSSSLLDSLKGFFTNDQISQAASSLGESESGISKAFQAGIPSVLLGIINKAGSDGGSDILQMAKQALSSGIPDSARNLLSGGESLLQKGSGFLSGLLGNKLGSFTNLISSFSGVKQSTSSTILSAIAPVALSMVGRQATSENMSPSGLTNWLSSQKSSIASALPAGLNLSGILDGGIKSVTEAVRPSVRSVQTERSGNRWLMPLLLLLLGIALLWYLMRGCNKEPEAIPPATDTTTHSDHTVVAPQAPTTTMRESFKVKLADGTEIDAYKGGIEDKLVACLNDANCKTGKDVWFDFDNLNFETGSAKLTMESDVQVKNLAAILKAYPKAKIKIGGYTDKTGDAAANKRLSQERADAVSNAIKGAGANASQIIGAEGYGSELATVPATASDEERRKDRRISISLREK